jgi:cob(I)alamin adenosyltransferase
MKENIDKTLDKFEAVGDLDETQALIDICISHLGYKDDIKILQDARKDLSDIMTILTGYMIPENFDGERINKFTDYIEDSLKYNGTPDGFVQFSDGKEMYLNYLRTVIRRAERKVLKAIDNEDINEYMNKLSYVVFLMAVNIKNDINF